MKIALFMSKDKIEGTESDTIPIIVLSIKNKSVIDIKKDFVIRKDIDYMALWLLVNRIKELYVTDIDPMVKRIFEKIGVMVKESKDMERNSLLRKYVY